MSAYREFFVYEPKQRMIMALPFKDRVVQWAIYRVIDPLFELSFYEHSYACRVGKGTHVASDKLQEWLRIVNKKPDKWYYLKMDISKYFYRVDHKILIRLIERKIKDRKVIELIRTIICSETTDFGLPTTSSLSEVDERESGCGMPIGNLTSQMFANIYLNELDKFVKHELKTRYYVRYMDDFILLSSDKKELHSWKESIICFLDDKLRLQTNNKTCIRPINLGIEFVGYQTWATHKKLRKSTTKRMRKRLKYLQKRYARREVTPENIRQSIMSYHGLLNKSDSYRLKRKIAKDYIFTRN